MSSLLKEETKAVNSKLRISGADAVIQSLLEENVDLLFGYPGGAIMPIYDALYPYQNKLRHILVRHEQGAIHAAQGYARVSGRVGVCFATSGPGATNLVTGLADAMIDSTPVVCITGQVPSHLLGTDAFQETDVISISMPVTKWNYQVTRAEEIPYAIARAFYIAKSGRPGPVLLDITKDAQFGSVDFSYTRCEKVRSYQPYPTLNPEHILAAAELINAAKKPFILIGQGVVLSQAQQEVKQLAEKANIPVASTLLGLSAIDVSHPQYVGYLGMHGNYGPNIKTNECDVLIAIGMRFDDRVTGDVSRYARQAKIIHIEIDPSEINKLVKTTVAINADAREALSTLLPLIKPTEHKAWFEEFKSCDQLEFEKVIERELFVSNGPIKMGEVIRHLSDITKGEAVVVTDVGQHQMVASRYYKFSTTRSSITSGGLGTMGFALPAAMGVALAENKRPVIAIVGDGGIQMTIQELGTIAQFNIPVKILLLNNHFLGMVRQWQQLFFDKRYSQTEMVNPDFQLISQGYGIQPWKVTERENLASTLRAWLDHKGPAFLEVVVEKEENVFPMVQSGDSISNIRLE